MISNDLKNKFKQEIRTDIIGYLEQGETVLEDELVKFSITDNCFVNGKILGTTTIKEIDVELLDEHDLIDKQINVYLGAKLDDLNKEYINLGKYTIVKPETSQIASKTQFRAQNDMSKFKIPYIDNNKYPTTLGIVFQNLCNQVGLEPFSTTFLNSDLVVEGNYYINGELCSDVLSDIAENACSFAIVDDEDNKVYLKELSTTINETIDGSLYDELKINKIYGPVNTLVIRLSGIEGENVVREDSDSINENGLWEIVIEDNEFLHNQATRELVIDSIWNKVKGLTYVDCELVNCVLPYLKKGDKIQIKDKNNNDVNAYVLNYNFTFTGALKGNISSPSLTQTETKLKNNGLKSRFRKVEYEVNKLDGKITQSIEKTDTIEIELQTTTNTANDLSTNVENITSDISDLVDTTTLLEEQSNDLASKTANLETANETLNTKLTYQEERTNTVITDIEGLKQSQTYSGGYNLLENCVKQFGQVGWTGNFTNLTNTEIKNNSLTKSALVYQNGTETRQIQVPSGIYNFSCKYKKLLSLAVCKIKINEHEIIFDGEGWQEKEHTFQVNANTIDIEFIGDTNNSLWMVDLLFIPGNIKQTWTPNPNEINTGTIKLGGDTLTIEANTEKTVFEAKADGIRIKNKATGITTTEYTEDGTYTNKLEAKQAEIAQVTFTNMTAINQTWIKRIER